MEQDDLDARLGFAPDYDAPIPYMQRTRDYYAAIGYTTPYRWAHHIDAPFTPLRKPLAGHASPSSPRPRRISRARATRGRARPITAAPSSTRCIPATRRTITTCAFPTSATTASTPAPRTATPGSHCRRCAAPPPPAASARSRRASTARRPTAATASRSRRTRRKFCAACARIGADAAIVVPNCPVCHQTCSLVARHLEANGIPTVVMGCAKDIVEHAAVPRFLFSDFPLGNSAGKPHDIASQEQTLELALRVLEAAPGPHTTMQSPLRWAAERRGSWTTLNLDQHRRGGTAAPPRRVRPAEGMARENRVGKAA